MKTHQRLVEAGTLHPKFKPGDVLDRYHTMQLAPPTDRKRQCGSSVPAEEEELGGDERLLESLVRKKRDTDAANEAMRERVDAEMAEKMATGVIPNPLLCSIQAEGEVEGEVEG